MPAASVLTAITSWPTMVYTVLLGVVLIYWVLALLGMVDFESSGIDLDIDTHADAHADDLGQIASYVVAMGLNGVPFSIVVTARLVRPLRGLFVTHTAQTNATLVGQVCRILTGTVDERQGRAEVAQRGATINIRVWAPSPNPFKRGDHALVTDYDPATLRYRIDPMPDDG